MKRPIQFSAAALLTVGMLSACAEDDPAPADTGGEDTTTEQPEDEDTDDEEADDEDIDEDDDEEDDTDDSVEEADEEDEESSESDDETAADTDEAEMMEEDFELVFYDDQVLEMYTETHTISGEGQEGLLMSALEQWLAGPDHEALVSVTEDEDVSVQSVEDHDGVAHVSFSEEFAFLNVGSGLEVGIMNQIAHTAQQAGFDSVLVLIDGESADTVFGHVDSSEPYTPDTDLDSYDSIED
ncbi:GerMN domain-containing protein [Geomicrobium sp. JCM 19055]|uniref:GerMN domain-containing protein n=1 Tax=Geomicrobium sp. JCM 19055 TaxID=1460649 RepID=UPI00045ECD6A|nr:GerMN domain-containing protein [Geomicrobium sp. JCM 19055]GAJ99541.1 phage protein [Geomicrobium sp. JCM 19055]